MKHVRSLTCEPPNLATYRTTNATDDSAAATQSTAVWKRFRDNPAYQTVRAELAKRQQGLCIYCEQRLVGEDGALIANDYQVEHVLAKSGGVGRTLNWRNLALACGGGTYPHHKDETRRGTGAASESCGQRKDDQELPSGCDPRTYPVSPRPVKVGLDGRIEPDAPGCAAVGAQVGDLARAIEAVLNLNCERLRVARQSVADNIRTWIVPLLRELLAAAHLQPAQGRQVLELLIAGRLQPDADGHLKPFWTTELCGLDAPGDQWVAANQTLFS